MSKMAKEKEVAKKKVASSNSSGNFKCNIIAPGVRSRIGLIKSIDTNCLTLLYKKSKSSKFAYEIVPISRLISYEGGVGSKGKVTYIHERAEVMTMKGSVDSDPKSSMMKIVTEKNETHFVNPKFLEAIADTEDTIPSDKKEKKKKAA